MAFKVHTIKKYNYSFDARAGGPGRLQLWGETGKIAEIRFVDDDAAVAPPTLFPDLEGASATFKRSALPAVCTRTSYVKSHHGSILRRRVFHQLPARVEPAGE